MNECKHAVHLAFVAEHRKLLRDHAQMRNLAVSQNNELRELRGEACFCRLSLFFFSLYLR